MSKKISGLTAASNVAGADLVEIVQGGVSKSAAVSLFTAASVAGSDTQVQFNDGGVFGASSSFVFNKTTNTLTTGKLVGTPTATLTGVNVGSFAGNPSSLSNGDFWYNSSTTGMRMRIGGVSTTILNAPVQIGLSQIAYSSASANDGELTGDSTFTWDSGNNALTVGSARIHSTGTQNTFVGEASGNFTLSGTRNTAIGYATTDDITTGTDNTALGYQALRNSVTTAIGNTAIGAQALATSVGQLIGNYNTAVGYNAGGDPNAFSGTGNTLIGTNAGVGLSSADYNVLIGYSAGDNITTADQCVIIGREIDAQSTTISGQLSIQNAIFGSANTATGTTVSSGNIGFFATTWGTSAAKVISIGNGTEPGSAITGGIQLFSVDSSDANATLGLYLEQAPEASIVFLQSHRLKVRINAVEYYLSLDAV